MKKRPEASNQPRTRHRPDAGKIETSTYAHTLLLPDGRTLFVEMPGRYVRRDRSGTVGFSVAGMQFLDHLRALAMEIVHPPTPGHVVALREALGLTQKQLGEKVGVNKLTVSRWERGRIVPGPSSVSKLSTLRKQAVRRGVVLKPRQPHRLHRESAA